MRRISSLVNYYRNLKLGDSLKVADMFVGDPQINTPIEGNISSSEELEQYVIEQQAWLEARRARSELLKQIETDERIIVELILYLTGDNEEIDLPVAIAADLEGKVVSAVRIYHSTWPLNGRHQVRAPIIKPNEKLEEPAVIKAYMKGLGTPDKELVLSLFTEDGYVREPSGSRYKHAGLEGLHEFYGPALDSGGVILHHCTATFDGINFAVEYICDEWANVKLPPQAGIAVYELAGPDKLRAARIYDDVMPPFD